jgi:hypothetical protein
MSHRHLPRIPPLVAGLCASAIGRTWTDLAGNYMYTVELIGLYEATAVLKQGKRRLVAVPLAKMRRKS